ncbi:hypothetical protein Mal64_17890 [Pseudobythopirellula maris]|uniref:EF-hand domain-containing protein n=1 Tax=Pseudobythopirellula maris TaxID=2527991 RepID=A0A5C5ZMC6_9BACT|nr:hypothetical protein [Pseudobythopirellula maris]TWT88310.1 hypothetical protein Mal64_17890 [Pseudobythopirellula maris]
MLTKPVKSLTLIATCGLAVCWAPDSARAEQNEFLLPAMAGRIEAFELSSLAPATAAQSTAETASASPAEWTAPLGVELNLSRWARPSGSVGFRRFVRSGYGVLRGGEDVSEASLVPGSSTVSSFDFHGGGNPGVVRVLADIDGDGSISPDEVNAILTDFGDLNQFNIYFGNTKTEEFLGESSFELMKQRVLSAEADVNSQRSGWRADGFAPSFLLQAGDEVRGANSWDLSGARTKWVNRFKTSTYASYGLRMVRVSNDFEIAGAGSFLGSTYVGQFNDHDIFGPQLGLGAVAESERLRFEATVLGLAGYGRARLKQNGVFGEEAIPGALNRSASARSTNSTFDASEEHFAWHVETRLASSYRLSPHWRIDALCRWYVAGPVYDAAGGVQLTPPYFGYSAKAGVGQASEVFFGLAYTL